MLWTLAAGAVPIAAYALGYVVHGEAAYVRALADSFRARPHAILVHALTGSVALVLGIAQLAAPLRSRWPGVHRWLGRAYAAAAMALGTSGLLMAAHAYGGWSTRAGFALLAVATLGTTARGVLDARAGRTAAHRAWMLRSYALMYAAVTLRLWLPLLSVALGGFLPAYRAVAWLAWVPNLLWVEWYLRRAARRGAARAAPAGASTAPPTARIIGARTT
jgi:uncharacterized membrane protein